MKFNYFPIVLLTIMFNFVGLLMVEYSIEASPINQNNILIATLESPTSISSTDKNTIEAIDIILDIAPQNNISGGKLKGKVRNVAIGNSNPSTPSRAIIEISLKEILLPSKQNKKFTGLVVGIYREDIIVNYSGQPVNREPSYAQTQQKEQQIPSFTSLYSNKNFTIKKGTMFKIRVKNFEEIFLK